MKTLALAVGSVVLLGGLVVGSRDTKPALQLRSAPEDYRSQGLTHDSIKPWEDGRRTVQGGSNFEWWYFDALTDDGTAVVVTFSDNIMGDHKRQVVVEITAPDGKRRELHASFGEPGAFAKDQTLVKIGPHSFEGNLDTYTIHVDPNNSARVGLDLTLTRLVPSFRAGTGEMRYEDKYFAWLNAVPRGHVTGSLTFDGRTVAATGNGYHDHNWGNVPPSDLLDRWWWGRATVGDRTTVTYDIHAKGSAGGSEIALLYVGTPEAVETNAFGDQVKVTEGTLEPHPDPHRPRTINSSVTYAADGTSVTFGTAGPMLLSLNLLDGQSWATKAIAGLLRMKPWYTRFRSPVTISRAGASRQSGTGILEYYELK